MSLLPVVVLLPLLLGTTLCFWSGRSSTRARRRLTAWLAAGHIVPWLTDPEERWT